MAYENRTFQSSTANTPPTGTDPLVDNTASGDVQAIKVLDGTAGSTTPVNAGGGVEANALRVTLASDSTGLVSVDDNGSSLTVDNGGTFAVQAAQSGTWNVTNVSGTVSLPTGAATLAEQQTQTTALQLIDDTVATLGTTTYTEATTKGLTMGAVRRDADTTLTDTTNEIGPLQMNAAGQLKVEVFSGETLPVSLTSTTVTGTVAVTQSGTWDEVGINDSGNSITVDNGGTFAVQESGAALTALQLIDDTVYTDGTGTPSKAIGIAGTDGTNPQIIKTDTGGELQVDVLTMPTVAVTQSGTWDEVGIHDSGNSITVDNGGTFATQATLQAGTAAVGKLLPPDIDVTTHTNYIKKYYTNAGAVTDGIIWSPASGKRWHVVSMYINVSAAATLTLEDDKAGGDEAIWKGEYAANSGVTIYFGEMYPLASGEDAADLLVTTTAGNVYITVTGFEI